MAAGLLRRRREDGEAGRRVGDEAALVLLLGLLLLLLVSSEFRLQLGSDLASMIPWMKVKAIRVHKIGGPEVLTWEEVEIGEPSEGEIRIKNKAIGVNYVDIYYRTGLHQEPLPFVPGKEAVGVVSAVGPGVIGIEVGDVVGYADTPMGTYTEEQIIPATLAIPIPPSVDYINAASALLKGMTTYVLVKQAFKIQAGHTVLVHAAAGGVGSLLCQWANALGATVIGTVSTHEKAIQAAEDGCHHVIIYTEEDFVARVAEITSGKGVHVVYDAVGKDTFKGSMECLMQRGCMISYGQCSGRPDPVPVSDLASKSLILGRPGMRHYTATRDELLHAAGEVFAGVAAGVLRVRVNHVYPLHEAARAHADLEARRTSGSVVLLPARS
uniref:Probable quinone oxidoreductase n=2 Tax=Oryza punctata TaxID=4537 RepID=A0A0E0MAQ5_ORYPU